MKRTGGVLVVPFRGTKRGFCTSNCFSLKRSIVRAFAVAFRVLSRKNMTGDNVLYQNSGYL